MRLSGPPPLTCSALLLAPSFRVCFPFHTLAPSFPVCFPSTPDATPIAPDLPCTFGLCTCAFCACTYTAPNPVHVPVFVAPMPATSMDSGPYLGTYTIFPHPTSAPRGEYRTQLCNIGCLSPRPYLQLLPLVIATDLLPLTSAEYNFRCVSLVTSHVTPLSELPFTPGGLCDVS